MADIIRKSTVINKLNIYKKKKQNKIMNIKIYNKNSKTIFLFYQLNNS
jgi:hypothetical protein